MIMANPVLSIGIIFRDDIRCIERCLKALQPLRDAVPCQLVMADTGSVDGSRAVAEQYADEIFDFPWINDFAAARNAVIDRCTGEWYLSVDTDEYLDEDVSELTAFLLDPSQPFLLARVTIRNYRNYEMEGSYADFFTLRMLRLSTGARYQGTIHEAWTGLENAGNPIQLNRTIFHHDGYVNMGENREKLQRNMSLLREKMRTEPTNLLIRLQVIESGFQEPDYLDQLKKAISLVKRKKAGWKIFGPPIFRHAVSIAQDRKLSEFQKWAEQAEDWFPESYFTRIDVKARLVLNCYDQKDYSNCIRHGQALLEAYADYRAGRGDLNCQVCSTLQLASPYHEQTLRMCMANACLEEQQTAEARALLEEMEYSVLDKGQVENLTKTLCSLHSRSDEDTAPLIRAVWEGLTEAVPSEERAEGRRLVFLVFGSAAFTPAYLQDEKGKPHYQRPACSLFAPLAWDNGLGAAAAILETEDPSKMEALLRGVEKWAELPFPALRRAIEAGVSFPLPDRPLGIEVLDELAKRLAGDWGHFLPLVRKTAETDFTRNWQSLSWMRALILAAVQNCSWKTVDPKDGLEVARLFAAVEDVFLPRCYCPELLTAEALTALPPVHRFGWHCAQAFAALEDGDAAGYARFLREGLASCENMKALTAFLTEHTPELQAPPADPELLELAEKVREMLALYPAEDPAAMAIRASAVYQRVAHLIEGGSK